MSSPTEATPAETRALVRSGLFDGIPFPRLEALAKLGQASTAEPGQILYQENDLIPGLHVVLSGKVEIIKSDRAVLATLETGGFFGEITLMGKSVAATATLLSAAPTRLLQWKREAFESWLAQDVSTEARFFRNLSAELCERLQATTDRLHGA